jgi:hypothetical protein
VLRGTRAESDEQLLQSWLYSLNSPHMRRNFETTARHLLVELLMGLRSTTVEDVRDTLRKSQRASPEQLRAGTCFASSRLFAQARVHAIQCGTGNQGRSDVGNCGATLAKRIVTPAEVK